MLTQARLKELLYYDPQLGWFMWRTGPLAGTVAGSLNIVLGYVVIGIDGKDHYAHRLAHLYIRGVFPGIEIDHRDRDKSNNRWRNLRRASHKQNSENRPRPANNTSGVRGVYRVGEKWTAKIKHHQHSYHLGTFATKKAAASVRRVAERELFTHL